LSTSTNKRRLTRRFALPDRFDLPDRFALPDRIALPDRFDIPIKDPPGNPAESAEFLSDRLADINISSFEFLR
jgi:hypothetical protein